MMGAMSERVPLRPVRSALIVSLAVLVPVVAACGGDDDEATAETTTTISTTTTTVAPTTTTSTTVAETLPEIGSTTVFETSTTLGEQATQPIAPPTDYGADEPVVPMGTISIPKLEVSMTMYSGIRQGTLDLGPGHWPGSALPGQIGNVVVAGHRTSSHAIFRDVDQLVPGDEIVFEDETGRHVYQVSRTEIVDPSAVWIIDPTATPTATLFACHPPGSTAQRIVVFADLVTA